MMSALQHFLKFALAKGLIDNDPSAGVTRGKVPNTGGFRPWSEENVAAFVARHAIGTQAHLAMQLMLCLSVRASDAVQIGPRHIRKTREQPLGILDNYQPQKGRRTGGNHVTVPLHEDLAAAIAATPVIGSDTYLVTSFGRPFTAKGFVNKMRQWCNEAGLPECTSHGLRKLCLTRLAEAGCTAFEIASISGHKDLREVQLYVEAANRKKLAASAIQKRMAAQKANGEWLTDKSS
jgi:integrase